MIHSLILAVAMSNAPILIARGSPRCNNVIATQLGDQLRGLEGHPVKEDGWDARLDSLKTIVSQDDTEQGILTSVCPENDLVPIASQLEATRAWALALESDIELAAYREECPTQANVIVSGFVAEAWLHAVKSTPDGATPAPLTTQVSAKVATRAAAVNLKLPTAPDTSHYWMTTVQDSGRSAAQACSAHR
jgi:hypothetical protein